MCKPFVLTGIRVGTSVPGIPVCGTRNSNYKNGSYTHLVRLKELQVLKIGMNALYCVMLSKKLNYVSAGTSWKTQLFYLCTTRNRQCENCAYCYRPKRSCEGYVFTRVCHSVHRGGLPQCMLGYHPRRSRPPPQEQTPPPPPRDGYCCGRYASYWNAFLSCIESATVCNLSTFVSI